MTFKCKLQKSLVNSTLNYLRKFRVKRFMGELFTPTQYSPPNVDSVPHLSARGILESFGSESEMLFIRSFKDYVEKKAGVGEWRAYSTTTGSSAAADIHIKADGTVNLNGAEYQGLIQIALLTAKLNALVAEMQTHTHSAGLVPAPDQTFTPFVQGDYENTTVNHGGGI